MFPRADLQASFTDAECGSLDHPGAFRSNLPGDDRRLVVYLPPGYHTDEVNETALPRPFIPPGVSQANAGGHTAAY